MTGEREYTPFRHSTSWINLTCGNRWKIHLYAGYTKNLGSTKPLVSGEKYGVGLDIDQLCSGNIAFSYNLPHWQFGVEYVPSTAWYGQTDLSDGKVVHTHTVTNHRVLGLMIYYFCYGRNIVMPFGGRKLVTQSDELTFSAKGHDCKKRLVGDRKAVYSCVPNNL